MNHGDKMLSFFELNEILEKAAKKVNEAGEPAKKPVTLDDIFGNLKKNSKPVTVEPPAGIPPNLTHAELIKVPSQSSQPLSDRNSGDINDPNSANFHNRNLRTGMKPTSSKSMQTTASDSKAAKRMAFAADQISKFNQYLQSPSYRAATRLIITELGLGSKYHLPFGKFTLSNTKTQKDYEDHGDGMDSKEVVIDNLTDLMKIIRGVNDYLSGQGEGDSGYGESLDFRQAISSGWDSTEQMNDLIDRALQFERVMHTKGIAGVSTTVENLAKMLASKAKSGGLNIYPDEYDVQALNYLISMAEKHGFNHFFRKSGSNIEIVPLEQLGRGEDPLAQIDKSRYPNPVRDQNAQSNEWADLSEALEHWGN